jgi:hypothetical protein
MIHAILIRKEVLMYGVIRRWRGDPVTLQDFVGRIRGVLSELQAIEGFVSYDLVVSGDTLVSTSIYQDRAGADASTALARRYSLEQWTDLKLSSPEVTSGEVPVHSTK